MNSMVVPFQVMDWTDGLIQNSRGTPLGNLRNVHHVFRNAPEWQNVLAYDEFAVRVFFSKPLRLGTTNA